MIEFSNTEHFPKPRGTPPIRLECSLEKSGKDYAFSVKVTYVGGRTSGVAGTLAAVSNEAATIAFLRNAVELLADELAEAVSK